MPEYLAALESLAAAVRDWTRDPRYVTEQRMLAALAEAERLKQATHAI